MNLNPNSWSCLPTAFANVIEIPVGSFIAAIGHDGSAQPFDPPFEEVRQGFHIQECIEVLDQYRFTATRIDLRPMLQAHEAGNPIKVNMMEGAEARLARHMLDCDGVIIGNLMPNDPPKGHAVSWVGGTCYDPRGCGLEWTAQGLLYKFLDPWEFYKIGGPA